MTRKNGPEKKHMEKMKRVGLNLSSEVEKLLAAGVIPTPKPADPTACPSCGCAAKVFRLRAAEKYFGNEMVECHTCMLRRVPIVDPTTEQRVGWRWNRLAGFCPDCGERTWRVVSDSYNDQPIILWPDPTTVMATYECENGIAPHGPFCVGCCPALGAQADEHVRAADATAGACCGVERSHVRYRKWFEAEYGTWLKAWLSDHLHLDEPEREKILAQWEADREVARVTA